MGQDDTARLFDRARQGSDDARDALYRRCAAKLLPFIRLRMGPRLRAEAQSADILQNVLLRSLTRLGQLREPGAVMGWLVRIAENEMRDRLDYVQRQRRDANRQVPLDDEAAGVPAAARQALSLAIADEDTRRLERALEALPEAYRESIVLRKLEELTFPEMAARLGKTEDACRMTFARAMAALTLRLRKTL
jgi:RNA polymerase sigma-70 factor (ECF subfamily)